MSGIQKMYSSSLERAVGLQQICMKIVGLVADRDDYQEMYDVPLSEEQVTEGYRVLSEIGEASKWVMGDAISTRMDEIGKMAAYKEAAISFGSSARWALELAKVARVFPARYRFIGLRWNHYREAAKTKDPIAAIMQRYKEEFGDDIVLEKSKATNQ